MLKTESEGVIREVIFADTPQNWLLNSKGFFHASCQLLGIIKENEAQLPNVITDEMYFYHRYSNKISVYLLSHAIELLLKASLSYYNQTNPNHTLMNPASYGHNANKIFDALISVGYLEKNDGDDEIIELVDTYLKWYGRYYCPNKKQVDKALKENYVENENLLLEFKHDLCTAHKKLSAFYQRLASQIKIGNLLFHHSFQAP